MPGIETESLYVPGVRPFTENVPSDDVVAGASELNIATANSNGDCPVGGGARGIDR